MAPTNEFPCASSSPAAVLAAPGQPPAPQGDGAPARSGPWPLVFVSALAFLLASFPARNADLWAHLAAARSLAGHGSPPNGTWLFDLASYGLWSLLGGGGLVFLKALLAAGLAVVLARLGRAGRGWLVPASCAALAVLAMSPRLLVQPATTSCLFLALALLILRDKQGGAAPGVRRLLPPWPLVVLFLLWANTDGWFLVGLATAALLGAGRAADQVRRGESAPPSSVLGVLAPLAVLGAVCLLNPTHLYAFASPPWSQGDSGAITSPFERAYFATFATSPAGLAYFPLLGLGLLSFLWNLRGWSWARALPWLGLAVLSAVQVRAVPFFAVVAGPVLALNLQEALARRPAPAPSSAARREGAVLRVLAAAAGVALVACAWPGWLQGPPYEPRRWAAEPPPSLEQGAAATRLRYEEGAMSAESRGLHLSAESAAAFAWFCPRERGLVDEELAAAVRGEEEAGAGWEARMRAAGVDHVVVYDPDRERLLRTLGRLLADPDTWPLLYLRGDLAVFGWRDRAAGGGDPFRGRRLDLDRVAFRSPGEATAPHSGEGAGPGSRPWWAALWRPAPARSIDHDEAVLHLMHAEALRRGAPYRHRLAWDAGQAAALVGAAGGWPGPAGLLDAHQRALLLSGGLPPPKATLRAMPLPEQVGLAWREEYARGRDDVPPAVLYLALRAARRAAAADPEDARAYLVLGECYLRLLYDTRERAWSARLPQLAELRCAQASAALNRALALKPDLAQAHVRLARLYADTGALDLALDHRRAQLRSLHAAGPPKGVTADEFRELESAARADVDRLAEDVESRHNALAAGRGGAGVLDRALAASGKGLKGKALALLRESDVSAFGPRGMAMELDMLLMAGRPEDVRDWTGPEQEEALGPAAYHWLRVRARAALGDYAGSEDECAAMLPADAGPGDPGPLRKELALQVGRAVLIEAPGGGALPGAVRRYLTRPGFRDRLFDLAGGLRQEADVRVLRGLLALEEGRLADARDDFRRSVATWRSDEAVESGGGLDFGGRAIAQDCLGWLGP